ncbi:MBL fold metallo-hydrolase [Actinomadura madurae]|uniref:MBL fold metallo-hydrolase n=1 Tax=Actinomadura madurae TaxID=1993 RepID=UPI0020D21854|nr:MBL fold metallo-hydrolase [Actinomadura madurae]MCP9981683.1 MBL fold metallo-hydrolase [Actinomadura madurae]
MCETTGGAGEARASMPRPVRGAAVDPVALEPVDEVEILTLVDNVYDALLGSDERTRRARLRRRDGDGAAVRGGPHPHRDDRRARVLRAGHGAPGRRSTRLLFDTGLSPDAMVTNAARLGVDLGDVQAVVLSHGHFDHAGGLAGLAGRRGVRSLPMVLHPRVWTKRRLAVPGEPVEELPTLSRKALDGEGFEVIERREPSLLLDGGVLITGEVDRTTEFEHGMPPPHQAWTGSGWEHDPLVIDDQALVVHVRGRGLVVLTGCGHAGAVNIVRHARRLTGVDRLHALVGGLHLGGPAFEPVIPPTVAALAELAPGLVVPGHCTGWRAQHALAAALPDAWVQGSSGTTYRLAAA